MIRRFLNAQTKNVFGAAAILASFSLLSRLFGLLRDRLLAAHFGAGRELDVYFAAFRIPDLIYNVLIAGGLVVCFLPLFSELLKEDEKSAWEFTNNLLNIFLVLLSFVSLVLFIFAPFLVKIVAPGFDAEQLKLTILLTRLMFLSPIFLGLSSIFSGIIQYFNRFLTYSISPILYNLGIILGILVLAPIFGVLGVAMGVVLGSFLHFLLQFLAALYCGFKYKLSLNLHYRGVKRAFLLMIPRVFGTAVSQVNLLIVTSVASILGEGAISIFNFANNLSTFPVGIIGISFAIAVFPSLSRAIADEDKERFKKVFSVTLRQILFLIVPLSLSMYVLRAQIVRIVLGAGKFTWGETRLTAASLGIFALSLFAATIIPLLLRAFFAFKDTKTPTLIAIASVIFNTFLVLFLPSVLSSPNAFQTLTANLLKIEDLSNMRIVGLSLSVALSNVFQFILFMYFLSKKIVSFKSKEILSSLYKIIASSIVMTIVIFLSLRLFNLFITTNTFLGIFFQTSLSFALGIAAFTVSSYFLKSPELKDIILMLSRKLKHE